jgi:hypothetical protein
MAIHKDYSVYVGTDRVYFEHIIKGEDDAICVYVEDKRVYDYDMSFCMIPEAREWLDDNGYDTSDILG